MSRSTHLNWLAGFVLVLLTFAFSSPSLAQMASPQAAASGGHPVRAEIEELKTDLKQMRVILNQMANNLAFVADSQSPLKHQFQLDIDMWQVLMMQMQRRLDRLEDAGSTPKPPK